MKNILARRTVVTSAICGVILAMCESMAQAQLINVNFYSAFYGGSAATGAAVVGNPGDLWNGINGDNEPGGPISLVDSTGNATSASLFYSAFGAVTSLTPNFQPNPGLMSDYLFSTGFAGTNYVTITGLTPDTKYDLYVYLASNDATGGDRSAGIQIPGTQGHATGNPEPTFSPGDNYVFLTPTTDDSGTLSLFEFPYRGNTSGEVDLNGLQLLAVPETTGTLPLLGIGCIALLIFRRSARQSAKPA